MKVTAKIHGREKLLKNMDDKYKIPLIGAQVGIGTGQIVNQPYSSKGKSPRIKDKVQNIINVNVLKKNSRDFFFINQITEINIHTIWAEAISRYLRNPKMEILLAGAKEVARRICLGYYSNVINATTSTGLPKALKSKYGTIKKNIFKKDLPIGMATGQLLTALVWDSKVERGR